MISTKKGIIIVLIIPILALSFLVAYKKYILSVGKEVVLPIEGYDPRDLLSGHYLVYNVNYGIKDICNRDRKKQKRNAYVCLAPKQFSYSYPRNCETFIKGKCQYGRFKAGIERYYIPENKAKELDKLVRNKNASIVLSVTADGVAQIKDLLINGTTW